MGALTDYRILGAATKRGGRVAARPRKLERSDGARTGSTGAARGVLGIWRAETSDEGALRQQEHVDTRHVDVDCIAPHLQAVRW